VINVDARAVNYPLMHCFLRRLSADTAKRNRVICLQPVNMPPSQAEPATPVTPPWTIHDTLGREFTRYS
jgi:hypothetical protein